MFKRLIEIKIYLNIHKCEFHVIKIKYLKFIVTIDEIKMNFEKIHVVQ